MVEVSRISCNMSGVVVELIVILLQAIYFLFEAAFYFFVPRSKKDVRGQIVFITGSGSGIGKLMAVRFGRLGCRLILVDIDEKSNEKTAALIREEGGQCDTIKCDLSKKQDILSTIEKVKRDIGEVDILVNNAGIVSGKSLLDIPDAMIEKTFEINVISHFWLIRGFLPSMLDRNQGHVVTIASVAGLLGIGMLTDYCSSKFAAVGLDETLREEIRESKKLGVKTTCVCPYYINTGMFDGVRARFPKFVPMLQSEYVADKIIYAVLTDEKIIELPRIMYFFAAFKHILPTKVFLLITQFLEVSKDMKTFVGRSKEM